MNFKRRGVHQSDPSRCEQTNSKFVKLHITCRTTWLRERRCNGRVAGFSVGGPLDRVDTILLTFNNFTLPLHNNIDGVHSSKTARFTTASHAFTITTSTTSCIGVFLSDLHNYMVSQLSDIQNALMRVRAPANEAKKPYAGS